MSQRRLLPWAAALLAVPLLAATPPASEEPECPPGQGSYTRGGQLRTCFTGDPEEDNDSSSGQQQVNWTPPPGWVLSEWSTGSREEDGTPCILQHREWEDPDQARDRARTRGLSFFRWYEAHTMDGDTVDNCSTQPEDPGLPPQMVLQVIETQLPFPEPNIEPGWALTGMPAYLEVGAPVTFSATVAGDLLPITVQFEATATYRVDWGDGRQSEHTSAGGPYPEGDIVHTYTDAVDRSVVVTPVWSVTASGGGQTFSFPAVELVPSTFDLPIREMQTVRTSR